MDKNSNLGAEKDDMTGPSFQLQTNSIHNSLPFKSKSADIFGSLETIGKKYESRRGLESNGDTEEERDAALEGMIRRGCIFGKPSNLQSVIQGRPSTRLNPASPEVTDQKEESQGRGSRYHSLGKQTDSNASPTATGDAREDSFFRRPERRPRRGGYNPGSSRQRLPDHVVNPQKYTEYSLRETDLTGNSDNKSIALGFLDDLKKRKKEEEDGKEEPEEIQDGRHIFEKSPTSSGSSSSSSSSSSCSTSAKKAYGGVYRMPEYEVGKEPESKRRRFNQADRPNKEVSVGSQPQNQSIVANRYAELDDVQAEVERAGIERSGSGGAEAGFTSWKGKRKQHIRRRDEEA